MRSKWRERNDWVGTEIGMLGGYWFLGQVTAGEVQIKKAKREQETGPRTRIEFESECINPQSMVLNYSL